MACRAGNLSQSAAGASIVKIANLYRPALAVAGVGGAAAKWTPPPGFKRSR